jgi:hypothetical protein
MQGCRECEVNTMETPKEIAASFRVLDFHDDTFAGMKVLPAQSRGDTASSVVEIELLQCSDRKSRVLRFVDCVNLRVAMDFDVLADNFPINTSGVDADINPNRVKNLMESQKRDWDLTYGSKMVTPLMKKLELLGEFVFFRAQFFGGVVEVVARTYQVENR